MRSLIGRHKVNGSPERFGSGVFKKFFLNIWPDVPTEPNRVQPETTAGSWESIHGAAYYKQSANLISRVRMV